ncbi:MAG: carboxylesterase family protein, partial [Deltaproteobacteria bacterium]|nr:carboxylesterase family protein [Deltaproteobacteria bacterium]
KFLGIPYAKPPVGNLRWEAPQPLSWFGKRYAYSEQWACVQGGMPTTSFGSAENCLYLNVWAPSTPGPHPVMVWIHGGGLLTGSGNDLQWNGATLALKQNVIVVSLNYRLTYLGFLAFPQMPGSAAHSIAGNQGFLDQVAALEWVKGNIGAFEGDPNNVTIFGVSGGSFSNCYLLASPLTDGLFQQVIMESGACSDEITQSAEEAEAQGLELLEATGCATQSDPIECARALTPSQIQVALGPKTNMLTGLAHMEDWTFFPTGAVDGNFLPDLPESLLENSAKDGSVSLLIGTAKDEGSLFTGSWPHPANEAGYVAYLDEYFYGYGEELSGLYPFEDFYSSGAAGSQIMTDMAMTCPSRKVANIWSDSHPVHFFQFTQHVYSPFFLLVALLNHTPNAAMLGTFHSSMGPYVFGFDSPLGIVNTYGRLDLRADIMSYWGNFARTGNPNGAELNVWPLYTTEQPDHLALEFNPQPGTALRQEYCEFWWGGE